MPFLMAFGKEVLHGVCVTHSMGVILGCRLTLKYHAPARLSSASQVLLAGLLEDVKSVARCRLS